MNVRSTLAVLCIACLPLTPSCKKKVAPPKGGVDAGGASKLVPGDTEVKPIAEGASGVSNRCVGALNMAGPAQEMTLNGKKWRRQGYEMVALQKDPDDAAVLGLVSDIKDASPETLANLRHYIGEFKKRGAEAIIATGDIAEEAPDLRSVMMTLADSGLPTFVIIGNIESLKDYDAAVASVSALKPNLIDLNKTRFVAGDDYDLLSLPGYHDASHVRSQEGCAYKPEDVRDLNKLVSRSTQALVLVSHGPPRGTAPASLDMLSEKEGHVGDAKLAAFIKGANIPFGVFGNVMEQGGRGVGPDMDTPIAPGALSDRLFVNVGRASATPWSLATGEVSNGMAMVLRLQNKKAAYEVLRAPAGKAPAPQKAPPSPKGTAPAKPGAAPQIPEAPKK